MDVIYVFSGRRNLPQKMVNFQPYFKHKFMIFLRIFLIFLRCIKVNYNIYCAIQTSNCGLVIFSVLLCNFYRLKSEVFFLLILKCVDAFVRTLMMIRTCILVQIVGQCVVGTMHKSGNCSQKIYAKKSSEVFSWGLTRILDSIILRKAQGQILSVVVDSIRLA